MTDGKKHEPPLYLDMDSDEALKRMLKPTRQKLTNSPTGRKQDDDFEEIPLKSPANAPGKFIAGHTRIWVPI